MIGRKKQGHSSDVVRDSVNTFGTNAIGAVLTLIQTFAVLRRVNPQVKGSYNAFQTWSSGFLTIIGLSITSSVIYFVARYKIQNTRAALIKVTGWVFAAILVISGAILIALRNSSFFRDMPVNFLVAMIVNALLCLILNIFVGVLRGENKFKSFNIINLAQRIVTTALALYIAFRPSAPIWIWGTNAVAVMAIVMAIYGMRRWNGPKPQPMPEDDHSVTAGNMATYSLKSHVSNILTFANTYLGNYIVQGQYGISNLAVYSTSLTIAQQLKILPDAVSQVIMSRIAAMSASKDRLHLTLVASKIVTYVTAVAALILYWVAKLLIPRLFPIYVGSLSPLPYLVAGFIFISCATVLNNSIAAYGRPELNIIPTVLGIVANCISYFIFIPLMGMNGVAVATALSMTMQGVSSMVIFCMFTHTPAYRLLIPNGEEIAAVRGLFRR